MSAGVLKDCIKRLEKTYLESGGQEPKDTVDTSGLAEFDAKIVLLDQKIKATKDTMKKRDEAIKQSQGFRVTAQLNQNVRQMIGFLKNDRKELIAIYEKNKKKVERSKKGGFKTIFSKKTSLTDDDLDKQARAIGTITAQIVEIDEVNKQKFKKKKNKSSAAAFADEDDEPDDPGMQQARKLVLESELPGDIQQSQLPQLDISDSLKRIEKFEEEVDKGLDILDSKLDILAQQNKDMQDGLKEGDILIANATKKAEKHTNSLNRLNKRLDKAIATNNQTIKLIIISCLMVVAVIVMVVVVVLILNGGWNIDVSSYLP